MPPRKKKEDPKQKKFDFSKGPNDKRLSQFANLKGDPSTAVLHPDVKTHLSSFHSKIVQAKKENKPLSSVFANAEELAAFTIWEDNMRSDPYADRRGPDAARNERFKWLERVKWLLRKNG